MSVRATVLLGELLHLANLILPREVSFLKDIIAVVLIKKERNGRKKALIFGIIKNFFSQVNVISHCLPGLLQEVSSFDPKKATRAQEAVSALQKLHSLKKCVPKANSLFLDQILCHSGLNSGEYKCDKSDNFIINIF